MNNIKISSTTDPTLLVVVKNTFANGSNIIVDTSGTYNTWNYNMDGTISSSYDPYFIIAAKGVDSASDIILVDTRISGASYAQWLYDPIKQTFTLKSGGPNNLMVINKTLAPDMNLIVNTGGSYNQWNIIPSSQISKPLLKPLQSSLQPLQSSLQPLQSSLYSSLQPLYSSLQPLHSSLQPLHSSLKTLIESPTPSSSFHSLIVSGNTNSTNMKVPLTVSIFILFICVTLIVLTFFIYID
jgi:hypothetical protein